MKDCHKKAQKALLSENLRLTDVSVGKRWRNCVALVGPECFSTRTHVESIGSLLCAHYVPDLEAKALESGELFRSQFAANSNLHMNSHSRLGCLGSGELVYALFDEVIINRLDVECLIQSDVRFTKSSIHHLALGLGFFEDHPNSLSLLWRETELRNRVFDRNGRRRVLHGEDRAR